jgi:hypothetical protein
MAKKRMTKAEWAAFREQMLANAQRTRRLAEKAQAELSTRRESESQS